ncbi:LMBR1 domain containing protein, putative [Entamoeba invadens IP1]|uniref:LMBR1 domain containing protein, putative n=1 Tax=Entamoeba invadens IP1 TaxID=370355 RepID=A0A0A1UA87_ENTIV|nr:LMBR1 domain containing protein, putative [Entamoeba invadens IP1]ELP91895.1 LMBR1 domain containing protein, putative [Entamoeba invadens IP1]|eukprot:XP_004258666.1 LMBR1 domain containing protein, putative [Entamoeba invadens IP1]
MIWVVLLVGAIVVSLTVCACVLWVRHYQDTYDKSLLSNIITVVSFSLVTSLLVIIPIDIYSAVSTKPENRVAGDASTLTTSIFYYLFELLSLLCVTCVVPYAFFYVEDYDEDEKKKSIWQRIFKVVRFAFISGVIIFGIYIIGIFVPFTTTIPHLSSTTSEELTPIEKWESAILPTNWFERGFQFLHACITIFGFLFLLTYTVYGMADAGISLLKGQQDDAEASSAIYERLEKIEREIDEIKRHSDAKTGRPKDVKTRRRLGQLRVYEKKLRRAQEKVEGRDSWISLLKVKTRGFGIFFGLVFTLLGAVIIVSLLISLVVSIVKSSCGITCGFVLDDPNSLNPIDMALRMLGMFFPLDYLLYGILIGFVIFSTLNGIVKIDVRIFCIQLFEVKVKETWPQGLLATGVIVTFATYAFLNLLYYFAPIYSTFGNQKYSIDQETIQCSLQAPVEMCMLSRTGYIALINQLGYNFVAIFNYFAAWAFCVGWGISIAVSFFLKKKKRDDLEMDLLN